VAEKEPKKIHKLMEDVNRSDKEDWNMSGVGGAGFWSRWYLWSQPTIPQVRAFMTKRFGIKFV
jgi:hypothetical protein